MKIVKTSSKFQTLQKFRQNWKILKKSTKIQKFTSFEFFEILLKLQYFFKKSQLIFFFKIPKIYKNGKNIDMHNIKFK